MAEPREQLAAALTGYLTAEQVQKLIDEVLAITKRVSAEFTCKHCKKRQMQWTDVNDAKAVALALPDLLNQAFGRPDVAVAQNDPIQFIRLTNMEELHALRAVEEERRGHSGERREDGALHPGRDEDGEGQADGDPDLQGVHSGDDQAVADG